MKALDWPLLTDENVQREVVEVLRSAGTDVATVEERGIAGTTDEIVIRLALVEGRVVVTHDADFGTLAVLRGEPVLGIIYLRPGHIHPAFVVAMLDALRAADVDVEPPFIVVVQRRAAEVRIRFRPVAVPAPHSE